MNARKITRTLALAIGMLAVGAPVLAQQHHTKIATQPQGQRVEAAAYPWSAIGKLNNGVGGSCTAFVISPNYALTAAHCLFFKNTGRYLPAESIHFVLGYENQRFTRHYRVSAYYISSSYKPSRPYETLASDWALLALSTHSQSPDAELQPSHQAEIDTKAAVMTAGYSHLTPYAMTADRNCHVIGHSKDGHFLFDSCMAPAGYSGAPVLVPTADKRFAIAGIHVANQLWNARAIAIAIPIENIWREIEPCITNQSCQFHVVSKGTDPTASELLAGLPN